MTASHERDQQRERERQARNEKVPFDWQIVRADQTRYFSLQWLVDHKIDKMYMYYLFDANRHVHICSFTPTHELIPLCAEARPVGGYEAYESWTDEEREAFYDAEQESLSYENPVEYMNVSDVLRMPRHPANCAPDREEGEDGEAYYLRATEEMVDYLRGNPPSF